MQVYEVLHSNIIKALHSKATFTFHSSLFTILWKRRFERRDKNKERTEKKTKRNDNFLPKIAVFLCAFKGFNEKHGKINGYNAEGILAKGW